MNRRNARGYTGDSAASSSPVQAGFVVVGKIHRPHGVKGEVFMEVITDFPERLKPGVTVFLGESHRPEVIRSSREHGIGLLLAFDAYKNPESAGGLRNQYVYVRTDDRPELLNGDLYYHQLLGMKVLTVGGRFLGKVFQILETGANDVYVLRSDAGPEILLPAIPDVIQEIDIEKSVMTVTLLPGLLPE
jgi:16S rRNA processing protein RimM